jgi:hypothetical protein
VRRIRSDPVLFPEPRVIKHETRVCRWTPARSLARATYCWSSFRWLSRRHHGRSAEIFFSGYAHTFTESGKEPGWPAATRTQFDAQRGPAGALLIGDAETVAKKILYVNEVLGGISRVKFQISVSTLPHQKQYRTP